MKKRINIGYAALNFLHRVLTETGVVSRADANKQRAAFKCMEVQLLEGRDKMNELRKSHRENKPFKDAQGNEQERWVIPEEKKEEFEKAILAVENTKVDVDFDVESLGVVSRAVDNLFVRQAALKEKGESEGITGETTMKLIGEASDAIDAAQDVA